MIIAFIFFHEPMVVYTLPYSTHVNNDFKNKQHAFSIHEGLIQQLEKKVESHRSKLINCPCNFDKRDTSHDRVRRIEHVDRTWTTNLVIVHVVPSSVSHSNK